jgi:UDP-N-acetyl-D-glucosamine dehydrogenase
MTAHDSEIAYALYHPGANTGRQKFFDSDQGSRGDIGGRMKEPLIAKFEARDAHIAVIGLGYVGLPLAVAFAKAGYSVIGIDVDGTKVAAVNRAESYIGDVSSAELSEVVAQGSLRAATDYAELALCDAVSICVPTPLRKTGDPDMSYIMAAATEASRYLHAGMVVVLESTTFPGTTRDVVLPTLQNGQAASNGKLHIGQDFFLAFSPERVDPGRTDWTTVNTPKVLGGMTSDCLEVASAYYGQAVETIVPVSSPDAAEMVKLYENTFRAVNIALANELLLMCDKLELDAWEVLNAAATKPFGFMKFTPGPGLGGHCIPIDPQYLSWKLRTLEYNARFIELASEINTEMPRYWAQKVQDALNEMGKPVKNSRVLVLGVAYKKNVADLRESPALDIIHLLRGKGACVSYHDPHVPCLQLEETQLSSVNELTASLQESDCVVIATDHSSYDWDHIRTHAKLIVDTRHALG